MGDKAACMRIKDLTVGYGKRAVVSGVDMEVYGGEILALIGPNGAGKSTLLRTIAAQQKPLSGDVLLDSGSVFLLPPNQRARHISTLFTERRSAELMDCHDVVAMGRYPYTGRMGILSDHDESVVSSVMERLSITGLSEVPYNELSDGQKQRVLIARVLCQEPDVLVLDEPTSYLDIRYQLELMELLGELASDGLAVVVSMHELSLVKRYGNRVLCIHDGEGELYPDAAGLFEGNILHEIFGIPDGFEL